MNTARTLAVIATLALAACDSGTEPEPFVLTIEAPSSVQGRAATRNDATVHLCDFTVAATASGGADSEGYAVWASGVVTWEVIRTGTVTDQ